MFRWSFLFPSLLLVCGLSIAEEPSVVDISILKPGQLMRVMREVGPVWILHRTPEMIESIAKNNNPVNKGIQPEGLISKYRSIKKEYFVVVGGCAEGKEIPYFPFGLPGYDAVFNNNVGFYCRCNAVAYDFAGRVIPTYLSKNAKNMTVPVYHFKDEKTIVIGAGSSQALNQGL